MKFRILLMFIWVISFKSLVAQVSPESDERVELFYRLLSVDHKIAETSFEYFEQHWEDQYYAPFIDIIFVSDQSKTRKRLVQIMESNSGESFGVDPYAWLQWIWKKDISYGDFYTELKARIYQNVDSRFGQYFYDRADQITIRPDEILWGGVAQDGIPPLRHPQMIEASQAKYLFKEDIVFGIVIYGEARAYPKRILGWHEMVVDNIGGKRIAGVYCTLCGTMIAYDTYFQGVQHDLGTSGFLYRSNKLMYDKATQSLWNTIEGQPVLGPLIHRNISLKTYPVVTSTWGEWRKSHPDTRVLDINTGHQRNYASGAAYKRYYATDDLMFPVPLTDSRLPNKAEVLVIRSDGYENDPIAISVKYLKKNTIYQDQINATNFVVITNKKGGSRVFEAKDHDFKEYKNNILSDIDGDKWNDRGDYLINDQGIKLMQLPSHNIFWFAWYNAYPETRLIKY